MHHDHDHDVDYHPFDVFFLIAFTPARALALLNESVDLEMESGPRDPERDARMMFCRGVLAVPYESLPVELESDPRDSHPLLFTDRVEIDATVHIEGGRTLRAHLFNGPDRVFNRIRRLPDFTPEAGPVVSAALALPDIAKDGFNTVLPYKQLLDELNRRTAPGLPASVFEQCSSGSFSEGAADATADAFQRHLRTAAWRTALANVSEAPDANTRLLNLYSEIHARTWGDHGELFELPEGWTFQDNMIQSKPAIDLVVVVTYDADNLPNPWEWQLHEPEPGAGDAAPWDQVPSTTDKPRAGWAPTLIAAMTRAATAAQLHLDDRRAAGGA